MAPAQSPLTAPSTADPTNATSQVALAQPPASPRSTPDVSPHPSPRASQQADLSIPDPPIDFADENFLDSPALHEADWQYVKNFHNELAREQMQRCRRCNERWFDMRLDNNHVCRKCLRRDARNVRPFLILTKNNLDPGPAEHDLPPLS